MSNFDDMFADMFGGSFGDGFKKSTKTTKTTTESKQIYFHPNTKENIAKIYTFARTISQITLKPTTKGTYVIVDCNSTILEEHSEILIAKKRYIKIVLGE